MQPLVSIGMPAYNASAYIRQAIDSLLAQDYENFELIISDNASTDGTDDICREYAAKEKRISFYGSEQNYGASWNFTRLLKLARGEFFMYAGSYDMWTPDCVRRLVTALQENPLAALAYTETCWIDAEGILCDIPPHRMVDTRGLPLCERIRAVIELPTAYDLVYGLYRTALLRKCRPILKVLGSDHILLLEISILGEVIQIPGKGFLRRIFSTTSDPRQRVETTLLKIDPSYRNRKNVYAWRELGWQHVVSVWRAPIPFFLKFPLMFLAAQTFYKRFKFALWDETRHPYFSDGD